MPFAKELMTLDDLSGGRFQLGVGAGGTGVDATVLGAAALTPRQRVDRFAEFVELLDLLLSSASTTYDGTWFSAHDARTVPGCVQQPRLPFVVAANGARAMRVVARHGQAWVTTGATPQDGVADAWWAALPGACARLDDALLAEGRGPARRAALPQRRLVRRASPWTRSSTFATCSAAPRRWASTRSSCTVRAPDGVYAGDLAVLEQVATDVLPGLTPRRSA